MTARALSPSRQDGMTLPEAVLSLAVMAVMAVGFGTAVSNSRGDLKLAGSASELATLRAAADRYVQDNFDTLVASAAGGPVAVSVATLTSQNYLPPSFPTVNAYGQTYQLYVRERSPTVLESIALTTGGTAMSGADGGRIALLLKGAGGFTPVGSSTINGTNGGWSAPLASYVPASAPKPSGNPAAYSIQYAVFGPTGALMRYATGNPVDNQMQTALNMNGNGITGAGNVAAQTVSLPAGGTVSMGASFFYGDNTNTIARQAGGFYVQNPSGATTFNTNAVGDSWQPGNHTAGSMTAATGSFTNMSASHLALAGGSTLSIGGAGSTYYGDGANTATRQTGGFFVQDPSGNSRFYVDASGNTVQTGTALSPWVQLTGGGVQFSDGTQQFTAVQRGNGPVHNGGGNDFFCDSGYHLVQLHFDCGCDNNATWYECQPS